MESLNAKSKNVRWNRTEDDDIYEENKLEFYGARHTLALLGFFGTTSIYTMRVNLSVAIVAMVNSTNEINDPYNKSCPLPDSSNPKVSGYPTGEFEWDETTQGLVLGSFYYGYALTCILGGRASEYWGGRLVAGLGVVISAVFTLLSPLAAKTSTTLFIAVRILLGCVGGVTFPALNTLIANWYPKKERSKFSSTIFVGGTVGVIVTLVTSGWLCASDFLGGWPSTFYVFGVLGIIWGVFWFWLICDKPTQHPRISDAELAYILKGCPETKESLPVPWLSIFTSRYFWVIAALNFGSNWVFYTLLTELPTYLDQILHINIKNNGMLSAMPYLGEWLFSIVFSLFTDRLIARGTLSILSVRRISAMISGYVPMLCLIAMCFVNCHRLLAFVVLVISGTFNGAFFCGFMSSHADISPRFAGTLFGLTNTIGTIPGFASPSITGALTQDNQTLWAWRFVFLISTFISGITATIYIIFITTEVQPWNDPKPHIEIGKEMEHMKRKSGAQKRKDKREAERNDSAKMCRPITAFMISTPISTCQKEESDLQRNSTTTVHADTVDLGHKDEDNPL